MQKQNLSVHLQHYTCKSISTFCKNYLSATKLSDSNTPYRFKVFYYILHNRLQSILLQHFIYYKKNIKSLIIDSFSNSKLFQIDDTEGQTIHHTAGCKPKFYKFVEENVTYITVIGIVLIILQVRFQCNYLIL